MRTLSTPPPKAPGTERAATPMAFVRAVLLAFDGHGESPARALREAGIPQRALRQARGFVTATQFELLCRVAMQQLDDEALGWFSRRLRWGSYGLLCRASLAAPDLGIALKRWCRHLRLLVDDIELGLTIDGETATLVALEHRAPQGSRELCLVTVFRALHGFASWLIDSRLPLVEIAFPFAPPRHAASYAMLFPGPVRFDAPAPAMRFPVAYLSLPVRRDEAELTRMLRHALPLTVRPYRRDRLLATRARELLRGFEGGTAAWLADRLHVSTRTLHRQLKDEGSSLQALKDELRLASAMQQLGRSTKPVKQVARSCGFASDKTFGRAFRQWTGMTPTEFRRRGTAA